MTLAQWRKQKEDDRRAGDRQFRADPANARRYVTEWGLRPGDGIAWEESVPYGAVKSSRSTAGRAGKSANGSRH